MHFVNCINGFKPTCILAPDLQVVWLVDNFLVTKFVASFDYYIVNICSANEFSFFSCSKVDSKKFKF